jgi:two-component system chemotaxis response regulator CheY
MRALVIDDSVTVRKILGRMLQELGFEVLQASNGEDALEMLRSETQAIELALVDWNMPVMNGFEFLTAVRSQAGFDRLCLMMVTTESDVTQIMQALEAGADEYVMKPFTRETIEEKLHLLGMKFGTETELQRHRGPTG